MPRKVEFELLSGRIAALANEADPDRSTALFVPGFTGSKEDFQPLLRPLAAAGVHAVAIDQRGQYQSAWARTEHGYALPALAADVAELAERLRQRTERLHLVGHSFGGLVARQAVLERPELFDDLVLMDSGPAAIDGPRKQVILAGAPVLEEGGMPALWERLQAQSRADPRYVRPASALQEFLRERFLATDPVGLRVMGNILLDEPDRTADLAATGIAMLVLYGAADDAWPPSLQAEMADRLGAQQAVIKRAAHSPAIENTAPTAAALIEFWQGADR